MYSFFQPEKWKRVTLTLEKIPQPKQKPPWIHCSQLRYIHTTSTTTKVQYNHLMKKKKKQTTLTSSILPPQHATEGNSVLLPVKNFAYTQNCRFRASETDCKNEDSCSVRNSWIPQVLYIVISHHEAKYTVGSIIRWAAYWIWEHCATHTEIKERRWCGRQFCKEGSKENSPCLPWKQDQTAN